MEVLVDCLMGTDKMGEGEWLLGGDTWGGSSMIVRGTWIMSEEMEWVVSDADEKYSHWEVIESELLG